MFDAWQREGDRVLRKARGSYAPYRICNRTGGPINVWSDINGPDKHSPIVKIANGETIDWRFDDWKTMREVGFCFKYCFSFNNSFSMYLSQDIIP